MALGAADPIALLNGMSSYAGGLLGSLQSILHLFYMFKSIFQKPPDPYAENEWASEPYNAITVSVDTASPCFHKVCNAKRQLARTECCPICGDVLNNSLLMPELIYVSPYFHDEQPTSQDKPAFQLTCYLDPKLPFKTAQEHFLDKKIPKGKIHTEKFKDVCLLGFTRMQYPILKNFYTDQRTHDRKSILTPCFLPTFGLRDRVIELFYKSYEFERHQHENLEPEQLQQLMGHWKHLKEELQKQYKNQGFALGGLLKEAENDESEFYFMIHGFRGYVKSKNEYEYGYYLPISYLDDKYRNCCEYIRASIDMAENMVEIKVDNSERDDFVLKLPFQDIPWDSLHTPDIYTALVPISRLKITVDNKRIDIYRTLAMEVASILGNEKKKSTQVALAG